VRFRDWSLEDWERCSLLEGEKVLEEKSQLACVALSAPETALMKGDVRLLITNKRLIMLQLKTKDTYGLTDKAVISERTNSNVSATFLQHRQEEFANETTGWQATMTSFQYHSILLSQIVDVRIECLDVSSVGMFDARKRWMYTGTLYFMASLSLIQLILSPDKAAVINFCFTIMFVVYYHIRALNHQLWSTFTDSLTELIAKRVLILNAYTPVQQTTRGWTKRKENFLSKMLLLFEIVCEILGIIYDNDVLMIFSGFGQIAMVCFLWNKSLAHRITSSQALSSLPRACCTVMWLICADATSFKQTHEISITDEETLRELLETRELYDGPSVGTGSLLEAHCLFIKYQERLSPFARRHPQLSVSAEPHFRTIEVIAAPTNERDPPLIEFTRQLQQLSQCLSDEIKMPAAVTVDAVL